MTVLTYTGMRPGDRQGWWKTVNIQVKWAAAHPGHDRLLPGVDIQGFRELLLDLECPGRRDRYRLGHRPAVLLCYSKRERRVNVQSGLRKGKVISAVATKLERNRLWSWALKKVSVGSGRTR